MALLAGCSGRYATVPRDRVLDYQSRPTYGSLYSLAEAYAEAIEAAVEADTLHPGLMADYGVALALMGHRGEACRMLNAEAKAFPQSALMVQRLKATLLPDLVDDTTVGRFPQVVDRAKLQRWAYDSVAALVPLPSVASIIDSTDSVRVLQQTPRDSIEYPIRLTANQKRELLAEEQMRAEKRKQFVQDSIAAAKQAVIDARKQKQEARRAAKKEQQKARQLAEKQKQQQAKEKARQREIEKQKREEERRQQREKAKGGQG